MEFQVCYLVYSLVVFSSFLSIPVLTGFGFVWLATWLAFSYIWTSVDFFFFLSDADNGTEEIVGQDAGLSPSEIKKVGSTFHYRSNHSANLTFSGNTTSSDSECEPQASKSLDADQLADIEHAKSKNNFAVNGRSRRRSNPISKEIGQTCILNQSSCSVFSANDDLGPECAICLETFQDEELICVLRCQHQFHSACLSQWLKRRNTCPCCRSSAFSVKRRCSI